MTDTSLRPTTLHALEGRLLWPVDAGYDEARRVFNGMYDRRPALVVRCRDSADVVLALAYAREAQLEVTVFGGGHAVTGAAVADGAVCIDLRGIKDIERPGRPGRSSRCRLHLG